MDVAPSRVLLVDDEPPLLNMMKAYLTRRGFSVVTAGTTEEAWQAAAAAPQSIAVAVIDASMPGLSMPELAIRLLQANSAMHVLVASGYPVDIAALDEEAPGRVAFLHKPFTPESLAETVRRMLAAQEEENL